MKTSTRQAGRCSLYRVVSKRSIFRPAVYGEVLYMYITEYLGNIISAGLFMSDPSGIPCPSAHQRLGRVSQGHRWRRHSEVPLSSLR